MIRNLNPKFYLAPQNKINLIQLGLTKVLFFVAIFKLSKIKFVIQ